MKLKVYKGIATIEELRTTVGYLTTHCMGLLRGLLYL